MEEQNAHQLKYVLYARKSTDDPQMQTRSIDDQIAECQRFAQRFHLQIVEVLTEKKSARKSGQRPVFRQMLRDIVQSKYDGILAWHPDRLARNMKEAGEIVDLLDEQRIKDLKFVTHHFTNDPGGLLLLSITFAMAKQYTDNLSLNVARGMRQQFAEGRSHIPKHGYILDDNGWYRPDGNNFDLLRQAWQMRQKGDSLQTILRFLNEKGYTKLVQRTNRRITMKLESLSNLFQDPFYYGILTRGQQQIDLITGDPQFQPMVTQQEFLAVQRLGGQRYKPYKQRRRVAFLPLKMLVTCVFCGTHMAVGASKGRTQRYLFYRCDKKHCLRQKRNLKKNIRGKVIFDALYRFLQEGLGLSQYEYDLYYQQLSQEADSKRQELLQEIATKEGILRNARRQSKALAVKLLDEPNAIVRKVNEERLAGLEQTKEQMTEEIATLRQQLIDPEEMRCTLSQFLNLSKEAAVRLQSADAEQKDKLCRILFLNLTVGESNIASCQLNPPFDELLKHRQKVLGELTRKEFEPFEAKVIQNHEIQPQLSESSYKFLISIIAYWQQINYDESWFSKHKKLVVEEYVI
jgi:site-specific DNA recombinase